ncbi:hypothetical protein HanPI659440_Chr12g0444451 [Helianthus annuus]|nr:hypothetical protein HanIR_Chr12g0562061 [Helianthus annuus]KAJ0724135.1 hypothetical protein HanPI659440_Chr12g0444451 [Helianthus annuus]KAJ0861098.1 hypothetical protein HanPSC8_Chr12g0502891 [Helianthus annuus]
MEDNINNEEQQPTVTGVDKEVETMLTWVFSTDNDDVVELSNFLEASSENTCPMKVKIIDDPTWHPLTFQTAASYITINGNEELCGSSFSDSDTSYMAGIGIATGCGLGGAWSAVAEEARWWTEMEVDVNCLDSGSTAVV